jgi:hypothetical protein
MELVTAIWFSCRRLQLLQRSIEVFMSANTYPIEKYIIVNDSGDKFIHKILETMYPGFDLVLNSENVGLMKSIDIGYSHINTEYFFHSEDDWCCNGKGGFIEKSWEVMNKHDNIENVWLADMNNHPIENEVHNANGVAFRMVMTDKDGWHGFSTACGLKRMSAYKQVGPYSNIPRGDTIWHYERNIGQKYYDLGYRSAILLDEYIFNIGHGLSEYVSGKEL